MVLMGLPMSSSGPAVRPDGLLVHIGYVAVQVLDKDRVGGVSKNSRQVAHLLKLGDSLAEFFILRLEIILGLACHSFAPPAHWASHRGHSNSVAESPTV